MRRVRERGRKLDVHVRWSGGDAAGQPWSDSWVSVALHSRPAQGSPRDEVELYKTDAPAGQPTGPAASRPIGVQAPYLYGAGD